MRFARKTPLKMTPLFRPQAFCERRSKMEHVQAVSTRPKHSLSSRHSGQAWARTIALFDESFPGPGLTPGKRAPRFLQVHPRHQNPLIHRVEAAYDRDYLALFFVSLDLREY